MAKSHSPARTAVPGLVAASGRVSLARRVEVWDQAFVRMRLDLGLPAHGRKVEYLLELYLYFPGPLDVNKFTLSKEDFYRELHTYLSLETPDLGVAQMKSRDHPESPLRRLLDMESRLATARVRPGSFEDAMIEEAKVFGCLAHAFLRDGLEAFRHRLGDEDQASLLADLQEFGQDARSIPHAFREVQAELLGGAAGKLDRVVVALRNVDEYLSHQTGKVLSRLVVLLEERHPGMAPQVRPHLVETMAAERSYRGTQGFHPGSATGADDGSFLHHIELLEAAVESAMFLNQRREAAMEWYSDWIGAFAAAVAMAFAFLAANLMGGGPGGKIDLWVMALVVITYIFKDRIKDVIKRRLTSDRRGWFPDLDTKILDRETGARIGRSFETTRWMTLGSVPPVIEKVRSHRSLTYRELREATGETVLRYTKRQILDPDRVFEAHHRRGQVIETLSLGLKRFLRAARPARVDLLALTPEGDQVRHVQGHRRYLLNVIARYGVRGGGELFEKLRIFADAHGPVRVETVIPPCREEDLDQLDKGPREADWVRPSPPQPVASPDSAASG